jgi:hypothetical protein
MSDIKDIKREKLALISQTLSIGFQVLHTAHSPPHGLSWLLAQGKTCTAYI